MVQFLMCLKGLCPSQAAVPNKWVECGFIFYKHNCTYRGTTRNLQFCIEIKLKQYYKPELGIQRVLVG